MGTSSTEQYCLRWNDFHSNVANAFSDIRDEEDFLDVTLVLFCFWFLLLINLFSMVSSLVFLLM